MEKYIFFSRFVDGNFGNFFNVGLYSAFIIQMAVVLMNLMIGLAISNIQVKFYLLEQCS